MQLGGSKGAEEFIESKRRLASEAKGNERDFIIEAIIEAIIFIATVQCLNLKSGQSTVETTISLKAHSHTLHS